MLICLVFCLTMFSVSCQAFPLKKTKAIDLQLCPDSTMIANLGTSVADLLFNPTTVTCYTIKGKVKTEENDFVLEPHFVKDSIVGVLSDNMVAILNFSLIADGENYHNDSILVKSPYMPQLGFEYANKTITANVLISFSDLSWTLIFDGKKQFNYNYFDTRALEKIYNALIKKEE